MRSSRRLRTAAVSGLVVLLVGMGASRAASAQERLSSPPIATSDSVDRLVRVYLDCDGCDESYLRRNLTFVTYVRDRRQADVHLLGTAFSRTFTNTDFAIRLEPAVEYNVFPYAVSDQKELTFTYQVGPEYRDYTEITIFGEREQTAVRQSLRVQLDLNRPWGSVFASL